MGQGHTTSRVYEYFRTLDRFPNMTVEEFDARVERLILKLEAIGMTEAEIEVILDKHVSNLSLSEIARRHNFIGNSSEPSTGVVFRLLKQAEKTLRERGVRFKQSMEHGDPNEA